MVIWGPQQWNGWANRWERTGVSTSANAELTELSVPVVWLDPADDSDPYYSWQEEMTHRAKSDRIAYGEWIKRELDRLWHIEAAYDEYNAALKRREHAGVAASRLADIVTDVLTT